MAQDEEKTTFFNRRVVTLRSIGSTVLQEIKLQELDFHTLGRAPENTIVLENDTISRRHAELCCLNGRFVVRDLGSGNGVVVSGQRVREQVLVDGAQIALGECVLEFRDSDTSQAQAKGRDSAAEYLSTQQPQSPVTPPRPVPAEPYLSTQYRQPSTPVPVQPAQTGDFRFPRMSLKAMYFGLAGGGAILVLVLLVLAFPRVPPREPASQLPASIRVPAVTTSAPRTSEEIEQRLAKASAQYQAGMLGQALEEYRRAMEAGATDQDVRRTYEQIAKEFEQRLQAQLTRADQYEKRLQFRNAISELQGALALVGETSDARLAEILARVGRLQQRL